MLATVMKKREKEPLSIEMLAKLVPKWCRVTFYDSLGKYKTLKEAMQGKKCMAVLYQIHDKKKNLVNRAGHFVLINVANGTPEYFSSSGWDVAKELSETHSDPRILQRLLGKNFIQNKVPLEKLGATNTCWRFVLARAILMDMKLSNFQKLFQHSLQLRNPDDICTVLTMLLVQKIKRELR